MLQIQDLHVSVEGKPILRGIDLKIEAGQVHALMGQNGVGKSTLAKVLGADPSFTIDSGTILFQGFDVQELSADERAHLGLFLSFQDPLEIPGLSTIDFLFAAHTAIKKAKKEEALSKEAFASFLNEKAALLSVPQERLKRGLNEGFSGGEKKKSEILQLAVLEPKLALLDEIDSGLDVDALKAVARTLNAVRTKERAFLVITHTTRLLEHFRCDRVHILHEGRIALSGDASLAKQLEEVGYDALLERESKVLA